PNNTPLFFFADPNLFLTLNPPLKPHPTTNITHPQNNSHFSTPLPQPFHQLTILISHTPIPKHLPHIHPFPSHTYSIYNHSRQPLSLKFHFTTQQPIQNLTDQQPPEIIPTHPHSSQ
ncbi:catalase, partial [Staphylococcus aureus]|uniref:catalase n=1 Tax=Staphylococcus aureus TaxID=1280 RepID=UPI0011A6CD6A